MEKIVKAPRDCSPTEQELFQNFVIEGGEVSSGRLRNRIQRAEHLCFINDGDCVVAVGAIKNPDDGYKTRIFEKAGVPSPSNYSYELGWLFVLTSERKKGYGRALMGVVSRNRRNFRHASSTPSTRVSRSITLPSL